MAKVYGVIVSTSRVLPNGYTRTTHSPIYFLDGNVQGLLSAAAAARVAVRMAEEIAGDGVQVWAHAWAADASGDHASAGDDPMVGA